MGYTRRPFECVEEYLADLMAQSPAPVIGADLMKHPARFSPFVQWLTRSVQECSVPY
jgi:hypothetical protein